MALWTLVLVGAAVWAYANSFDGVFLFDDGPAIVENPHVRALWPLTQSMTAPPEAPVSGRPVASLTLAVNAASRLPGALGTTAPWAFHATNLTIHVLAGLTLFGVVRRTLLSECLRQRYGDAATPLAFATALLWIVHPLQTESVTYIVQRVESLMGLWYLLTLYCAIRSRTTPGVAWATASIVACALGMGSKEVMVSAPLIVVLWDWTFGGSALKGRALLYAGLASTWIILGMLVVGEHRGHSVGALNGWTPWTYLLTQAGVIGHYLRLALVPAPLVLDYGWRMATSVMDVWPQALVLVTAFGLTVAALVKRHPLGFAGVWFFAILAPTSSVLPIVTEVASEHRMYLPLAALMVGAVIAVYELAGSRRLGLRSARTVVVLVLAAGVAVFYGTLTAARNGDYLSEERMWKDTAEKRPDNARARLNYAATLLTGRRFADAESQLRVAEQFAPADGQVQASLGVALASQGKFSEAIPRLERGEALRPSDASVQQNLAEAYAAAGDMRVALGHFLRAVDLKPDDPFLLNRAGWILATSTDAALRDGPKATAIAERAVRLTTRQDVTSLDTLAAANAEIDRFDVAAAIAREAIALARTQSAAMVPELAERLALYEARRKFRQ